MFNSYCDDLKVYSFMFNLHWHTQLKHSFFIPTPAISCSSFCAAFICTLSYGMIVLCQNAAGNHFSIGQAKILSSVPLLGVIWNLRLTTRLMIHHPSLTIRTGTDGRIRWPLQTLVRYLWLQLWYSENTWETDKGHSVMRTNSKHDWARRKTSTD